MAAIAYITSDPAVKMGFGSPPLIEPIPTFRVFAHRIFAATHTTSPTMSLDQKALDIFVSSPVSQDMIHKLVVATLQVLPCQDDKKAASKLLPLLMTFVTKLVRYTNVYTGTLMATLSYLERLKTKLPRNALGLPCTRHRILLLCLILLSKYHNDLSPKNVHWAKYTDGLFSVKDINLMERQLLYLLNWDLHVSSAEMSALVARFLEPIKQDLVRTQKMRRYIQQQQQHAAQAPVSPPLSRGTILRLSSHCSNLLLDTYSPSYSLDHYRQNSTSSVSSVGSLSPVSPQKQRVDPAIEMTARNEELELNRMLQQIRTAH